MGIKFPRPMTDTRTDLAFGLKTLPPILLPLNSDDEQTRANIARAFEEAVVDTLSD